MLKGISVSDVDAGTDPVEVFLKVASGTLTLAGTDGLTFSGGSDGAGDATMTFTGTTDDVNTALAGLSYVGNQDFNGLDTLKITTSDQGYSGSGGTLTDTDFVAINVVAVNDAPTIDLDASSDYTLEQTPGGLVIDPSITIGDVDDTNMESATVSISSGFFAGDALIFVNQNGIAGTFHADTGILDLVGSASKADYETALESSIKFGTRNIDTRVRTISFVVTDGDANSTADTASVNVKIGADPNDFDNRVAGVGDLTGSSITGGIAVKPSSVLPALIR